MKVKSDPVKKSGADRRKAAVERIHALRARLAAEGKLDGLDIRELIGR